MELELEHRGEVLIVSSPCGDISVVVVAVVGEVLFSFSSSRYTEDALTRAALPCNSLSDCSSWDLELDVTRGMQRKWVRGGRLIFLLTGGTEEDGVRPVLGLTGLFF